MIHQIPPKPDYLRVKIGRRLQRVGAVAVKSSVYALPDGDQPLEDLQWIRREIVDGGGDATICRASFVDGLTDDQLVEAFRDARTADYAEIAAEAASRRAEDLGRLRKRFAAVSAIDFFSATGRSDAHAAIERAEAAATSREDERASVTRMSGRSDAGTYRGRTWVTRKDIFVDRMASAWLIRRFIDPDARFRYVDAEQYRAAPGELRFDMFEADFTHEGNQCTFEVLLSRFGLEDPALARIGELVHDVDLKDGSFNHPETAGLDHLIAGTAMRHQGDEERLRDGGAIFEALYAYFKRKA